MRGESGRVAARVRELLSDYEGPEAAAGDAGRAQAASVAHPSLLPVPLWQRLATRVPIRLDPGRRAAMAVGLAVLVAAVLTGVWLVAQRPRAVAVSAGTPQIPGAISPAGTQRPSGAAARSGAASPPGVPSQPGAAAVSSPAVVSPAAALVVVDVAGKVRRPGLYRLPSGSRVNDAVQAAGGPLAGVDLSSLNLAARVVDGQQILVGAVGGAAVPEPQGADGSSVAAGTSGPVDLNSATLDQLETLPGIGPVLGQHILDWRTAHGGFAGVDQLNDVSGIGDVKFAALRGLVTA